jgi:hypothetical protein
MNIRIQVVLGLVVGGLLIVPTALLDSLFFPIVLAGPLITGAVAASVGLSRLPLGAFWVGYGVTMLVADWVINQEDRIFHLVLTVVMELLALAGYGVVRLMGRSRAESQAAGSAPLSRK